MPKYTITIDENEKVTPKPVIMPEEKPMLAAPEHEDDETRKMTLEECNTWLSDLENDNDNLRIDMTVMNMALVKFLDQFIRSPFYCVCSSPKTDARKICFFISDIQFHEVFTINFIEGHESEEPVILALYVGNTNDGELTCYEVEIEEFPKSLPPQSVLLIEVKWNDETECPVHACICELEDGTK